MAEPVLYIVSPDSCSTPECSTMRPPQTMFSYIWHAEGSVVHRRAVYRRVVLLTPRRRGHGPFQHLVRQNNVYKRARLG